MQGSVGETANPGATSVCSWHLLDNARRVGHHVAFFCAVRTPSQSCVFFFAFATTGETIDVDGRLIYTAQLDHGRGT
mgnify:CR=1 FL=1